MKKALMILLSLYMLTGRTFILAEEEPVGDNTTEIADEGEKETEENLKVEEEPDEAETVSEEPSDNDTEPDSTLSEEGKWVTEEWINPEYEDLYYGETENLEFHGELLYNSRSVTYETIADAAAYLRGQMENRVETVTFLVDIPESSASNWSDLINKIWNMTYVHDSGDPKGGDYLYWHIGRVSLGYSASGGYFKGTVSYTFTYHTDTEQEAAVDAKLATLLPTLNIGNGTEGEKATAIYSWLCNNVVYDYEHLDDKTYTLKHSAYAALINGTSVCQGYALVFYRMALELGLDARIITGGGHAWNIVRIGSLYYLCDTTWDSEKYCAKQYSYFLRGELNFEDHTTAEEYVTEPFYSQHPLSQVDYSYPENLMVAATRIYTVPATVSLNGLNDTKTVEVIVEPKEAYDKQFLIQRESFNIAGSWSYSSRLSKNYRGIITANAYGQGAFRLTLNNNADSYSLVVTCSEETDDKALTVTVNNPYSDASEGIDCAALYSTSKTDDEIRADIRGNRTEAAYTAVTDTDGSIVFNGSVAPAAYKLAVYKAGYLVRITEVELTGTPLQTAVSLRAVGDVTEDNAINVSDIIMIRDIILEVQRTLDDLSEEDLLAANVNGDTGVNVSDIILVRDRILGIVDDKYQTKHS